MPNRGRPELDLHRHARSKSCLCWRPRLFTAANTPWPPTVWHAPVIERPRQDRFRSTPEITQEISMPDEMTSRPRSPADMKGRGPETRQRRTRPPFECIALLLQGGGALGSYQAGVYEALAEADIHPDWVAGISIGAINAALIAGNPPKERAAKLRAFWEEITTNPFLDWAERTNPLL